MNPEEDAHGEIEYIGEELAVKLVVSFHPETSDDIELVDKGGQHAEVGDVELAIGVHEHDEIAGGGLESSR